MQNQMSAVLNMPRNVIAAMTLLFCIHSAHAATLSFNANPVSVASGATSTLTWSSSDASSCAASAGWSGRRATSGALVIGALTANTTFTLTCSDATGSVTQSVTVQVGAPSAGNKLFHFGYDYGDAEELIGKHDYIIGPTPGGIAAIEYISPTFLTAARAANSKVMHYAAYSSVLSHFSTWMENWCVQNGRNPEDMYYHYRIDTQIRTTQGLKNVPGFPDGTAVNRAASRVPSKWWGGAYPNVCPTCRTFRDAFNALMLEISTVGNQYIDGVFLDSWSATEEQGYWDLYLNNTLELGGGNAYPQVRTHLIEHFYEMRTYLRNATGNPAYVVNPNVGHYNYVYFFQKELSDPLDDIAIEEFISTPANDSIIPIMRNIWNDMEAGKTMWLHSQTNFDVNVPEKYNQFIFAVHYSLQHPRGRFAYHLGSPSNYTPSLRTHWHRNLDIDLGSPTGQFTSSQIGALGVVRREFEKAIVIACFGASGGFANIGTNPQTIPLGGNFRVLNPDNTLGPVVTQITLGQSEGAILMRP